MRHQRRRFPMKAMSILVSTFVIMLFGMAQVSAQTDKPSNYLMFKAGFYDPSHNFEIEGAGESGIDINAESGFNGEVALGHYFAPFLALELGAGYFENEGRTAEQTGRVRLNVVPVVLTGKLLAPLGRVEPYILGGIGAYLTDYDTEVSTSTVNTNTRLTYGLHAGGGINFDITHMFFVGAEARYLWSEPEFGGRDIRLDGFTATGDIGFRF